MTWNAVNLSLTGKNSRKTKKSRAFRPALEHLELREVPAVIAGFTDSVIGTGLNSATAMEIAPNGDTWVIEQGGMVKRFRSGSSTADVVANMANLGLDPNGERGLLGIAFAPDYATSKDVYFYYTTTDFGATRYNRISRFDVNDSNPNDYFLEGTTSGGTAGSPNETVIVTLDALSSATNHNGGAIHFGADGLLYVAVGENANGANAQTVANLHGKMLRMDVRNFNPTDGDGDGVADSLIPTGANANPTQFTVRSGSTFQTVSTTGRNRLIYAVGLRNPFTFAFRPGTNEFFINDVGQNTWEEINVGGAGRNYGWSTTEGTFNQASFPPFTNPYYTYNHSTGDPAGNVITGGAFYNPTTNTFGADYAGDYFFGDVGAGWIYRVDTANPSDVDQFATGVGAVDLRVASDGSLIYASRWDNNLHRITANAAPTAPAITSQPTSRTVNVGANTTFNVTATGTAPLAYQWQRLAGSTWNDIAGATGSSFTLNNAQAADSGAQFRVRVSNSAGTVTSNAATLTVNEGAAITTQPANQTVNPGQTASFSVTATGTAPLTYQWQRLTGTTWNNVGTNASTFSFATVAADNGAQFRVVVSNSAGSVTSSTATLTVTQAPVITSQPAGSTINPGQTASFSVTATGTAPLAYQWQRLTGTTWNNVGTNASTYSFTAAAGDNGAQFRVIISNGAGNTTSNAATLTVRQPVAITAQPTSRTANEGTATTFNVTAAGTGPLTYQWQRLNGTTWTNVGTNASSYTFTTAAADNGAQFRVLVSNAVNSVTSSVATLTVNRAPTAAINVTGGLNGSGNFIAGQAVTFVGSGADPDGTTPTLSYRVDFVSSLNTNPVVRPFVPTTTGTNGTFTPATTGPYNLPDVLYRIYVTATDAGGLSTTVTRDINPATYSFTVQTTPAGLQLTVDSIPTTGPTTFTSIVGFQRPLSAIANSGYTFQQWSDGVTSADRIVTGLSGPTTFTAVYQPSAATSVKVNFGATTSPGFPGYLADSGQAFGNRGNGWSYGWNGNNTTTARDRNAANSPDERYDTLVHLQKPELPNAVWEIAVPNGQYTVHIVSGDPSNIDSVFRTNVEGVLAINGTPTSATRWFEGTVTVNVTDGRLTVSNASGAQNNKINYIEITSVGAPATGAFQQDSGADGLVVMEAENRTGAVSQGGKNWVAYTATAGYSGSGALVTTPNSGVNNDTGYTTTSPRLDFQVNFTKTGTHYVWIRGIGPTGNDDSVHVGLDGAAVASADRISSFPTTAYGWTKSTMDGVVATVNVTSVGVHTVNVWMREDGTIVDKVLLTTNSAYTPTGVGPTESSRTGGALVTGGDGLTATYYDNRDFTGATVTRTDATVNFDWSTNAPVAGILADTFSARWTGQIRPETSGTYTFYTTSDDGVRLRINGQTIIDQWNDHAATVHSGTIALQAGQAYAIQLEYYENGGYAVMKLEWELPGVISRQVVPSSRLYRS